MVDYVEDGGERMNGAFLKAIRPIIWGGHDLGSWFSPIDLGIVWWGVVMEHDSGGSKKLGSLKEEVQSKILG